MTLAFLGEIDDVVLQSLHNQADEIPKVPFELSLNRLGYWSKPGILWLGTDKVPTALDDLAAKLVGAASLLGIRKEHRDFKPHVTLKRRLRDAPMGPLVDPDFTLQVTEFHLMESRLHKSGVQYQSRLSWSL